MDVDTSSSSEDEHSSSDCEDTEESGSQGSGASSSYQSDNQQNEERLEDAIVCGQRLQLPQGLCENSKVFKEFFSARMWNSLTDASRQHLKQFLPSFPENDNTEKNVTLQKLFNCEQIGFSSPLEEFHKHLQAGHYRPSMVRTRNLMRKIQRQESQVQRRKYLTTLVKDVVASRQWLLNMANSLPPGAMENTRLAPPPPPVKSTQSTQSNTTQRTKRRYFQELEAIRMEVGDTGEWSDDDNYPEGFDPSLLTSSPLMSSSKSKHRKLNTNSISVSPPHSPGAAESTISTLVSHKSNYLNNTTNNHQKSDVKITEEMYRSLLSKHKAKQSSESEKNDTNNWAMNLKKIASRTCLTLNNRKTLLNLQKTSNSTPIEVKPKPPPPPPPPIIPTPSITPPKKVIKTEVISPKTNHRLQNNIHEVRPTPVTPPVLPQPLMLVPKLEIKTHNSSESELDMSDNESIIDPVLSPQSLQSTPIKTPINNVISIPNTSTQSIISMVSPNTIDASTTELLNDLNIIVKTEPSDFIVKTEPMINMITSISQYGGKIQPATLSDLEGIDMLNLPVDLDESNIGILDEMTRKTPELMQETHASFLSLIRDIICSTPDHRMGYATLESRMKSWQENPISPLNDWYNLVDNWLEVLSCAVSFLNGDFPEQPEDFVPYLELKPLLNEYQWIGAGRDSDNLLSPLFHYWIEHREEMTNANKNQVVAVQSQLVVETEQASELPKSPPPPRWPTSWNVRKAELDEIEIFREQERRRYENPHKAFTYRMFGYESVVGPVKGIYNQTAGVTKARGHSMLSADRPNFVTILTLVRDATARLPNGEGTRADICELLKSSQYIAQGASETVLQSVVSGALDRMHTEYDPCVKYDTKRKIWIYLHRNRTESEFEKIHAQHQGMSKHQKKTNARKSKAKPKVEKPSPQKELPELTQHGQPPKHAQPRFKAPVTKPPVTTATMTSICDTSVIKSSPVAGTSLLINQNKSLINKTVLDKIQSSQGGIKVLSQTVLAQPMQTGKAVTTTVQALQSLIAPRVNSPVLKPQTVQQITKTGGKSIVKIVNTQPQGKSLITNHNPPQLYVKGSSSQVQTLIPSINIKTNDPNLLAQIQPGTQKSPTIIASHANTQLIQTLVQQQGRQGQLQTRQIIQGLTNPHSKTATLISQSGIPQQIIQVTPSGQKITQTATLVQTKQGGKTILTTASAQQLIHNMKQQNKVVTVVSGSGISSSAQSGVSSTSNSQTILKQHVAIQQLQKQLQQNVVSSGGATPTVVKAAGTSLLDQTQRVQQVNKPSGNMANVQAPLVAKVLTNASGQVISVESLLAHQKQHGSLPQGTTLRVAGGKLGQANLIQLSGAVPNQLTQFAVVSQGNLVSLTGQPRLIASVPQSSQTITSTSNSQILVATPTKSVPANKQIRHQIPPPKLTTPNKVTQVVNAKFISSTLASKVPQQQQMIKTTAASNITSAKIISASAFNKQFVNKPATTGSTQAIRMVNPGGGINFAHIAGKPILLASKGNATLQGQNIILRQSSNTPGGAPSFVISSNATQQQQRSQQTGGQNNQIVLTGTPLKIQNISTANNAGSSGDDGSGQNKTENRPQQTLLLQTQRQDGGSGGGTQRVVLASPGQGGQLVAQQILLPQGFQGGTINIKTLQGLKVIPLSAQQGKGVAGRQQLFTRIVNPVAVTQADTSQVTSNNSTGNVKVTTHTTER